MIALQMNQAPNQVWILLRVLCPAIQQQKMNLLSFTLLKMSLQTEKNQFVKWIIEEACGPGE